MQSFSELPLSPAVQRAITELGWETPSPIQAETLPILLGEATDFLGLAATGTGKTAAFSIPMIERIDPNLRRVQALILCPTRELALQVAGQIDLIGKYKGVSSIAIYGGAGYNEQINGLRRGAKIVVGTPGRVVDHIERGTLNLADLKLVILDEADEMISMGFKEELEKILSATPRGQDIEQDVETTEGTEAEEEITLVPSSNIWLFSATMSREVRAVADDYLRSPQSVQVNRKEMLPSSVEQYYYPTIESNKPEILCKLIEAADDFYGLIFCQTKALVVDLTSLLIDKGYKVDCLHGDKTQDARERTMQSFRDRKVRILVCTDVASRGIDVKDITHVINYSLPRELDNYVHRIGRTARSGKTGIAMNLVTPSHRRLVFQIEQMTKTRMVEGRIPTRREVGAKKVGKLLSTFSEQTFHTRAIEVMSEEWKTALQTMTAEEVAGRFLNMMMPDVFVDREPTKREVAPIEREQRDRGGDRNLNRGFGPRNRGEFERGGDRGERGFNRGFGGRDQAPRERGERNFNRDFGPRDNGERQFRGNDRGERGYAPRDRDFNNDRGERGFDKGSPFRDRSERNFDRGNDRSNDRGFDRPKRQRDFSARFGGMPADAERISQPARPPKHHGAAKPMKASPLADQPPMNRKARRAAKFGNLTGKPE